MLEEQALLHSIIENPEDDLPRLVYADWLDDVNRPDRAEFIRVQVELARWKADEAEVSLSRDGIARHAELRRRERELFSDFCIGEWFSVPTDRSGSTLKRKRSESVTAFVQFEPAGLAGTNRTEPCTEQTYFMSRGFIDLIQCSWSDWLRHHDALYWHPEQEVPCIDCNRPAYCAKCDDHHRISRPFAPTAHPIERVRFTTWPLSEHVTHLATVSDHFFAEGLDGRDCRFNRVQCDTCGDTNQVNYEDTTYGLTVTTMPCTTCHGNRLNEWTCDKWPGIVFEMPEPRE